MPSDPTTGHPTADRLHNEALEKRARQIRAQEAKERQEVEDAYMMSNLPISRRIPYGAADQSDNEESKRSVSSKMEIRTLEKFMEDQIAFEHRRYENLKNAILVEEAGEQRLF